jgi:hypothetical protein
VQVRAIGFKAHRQTVALTRDTVTVDMAIEPDTLLFTCNLVVGGVGTRP